MSNKRSFRYQVVDVFTRVPLEGNALAVFPDSRGIEEDTMQRIARELNLSETVFVGTAKLPECSISFRIFTPTREMVFAGHPTVGASFVVLRERLVPKDTTTFWVEEKIGPVKIRLEPGDEPLIWLETPAIAFERLFNRELCAKSLRLKPEDLLDVEPQIVNAGNPTLLVAVKDKSVVDNAVVDTAVLSEISADYPAPFCVFIFAPVESGAYSRMFAPEYGIVEDPATGSSTGPLAAYMKRHNLLSKSAVGRFVSEQGKKMGRRSLLHFEFSEGGDIVSVGGHVTPIIEAVMTL